MVNRAYLCINSFRVGPQGLSFSIAAVTRQSSSMTESVIATYAPPNTEQIRSRLTPEMLRASSSSRWNLEPSQILFEGARDGSNNSSNQPTQFMFRALDFNGSTESSYACFARMQCEQGVEIQVEPATLTRGPICRPITSTETSTVTSTETTTVTTTAALTTVAITTSTETSTGRTTVGVVAPGVEHVPCLDEFYGRFGVELDEPWCYVVLAVIIILCCCCCCGALACLWRRVKRQQMVGPLPFPPKLEQPTLTRSLNARSEPEVMMTSRESDTEILYTLDGSHPKFQYVQSPLTPSEVLSLAPPPAVALYAAFLYVYNLSRTLDVPLQARSYVESRLCRLNDCFVRRSSAACTTS